MAWRTRRIRRAVALFLLLLVAGGVGMACRQAPESNIDEEEPAEPAPTKPVSAEPAPAQEMRLSFPEKTRYAPEALATGNLKPQRSAELAMAVPGTLSRVSVRRGQEVKAGATLALLDASGARASLAQAEAGISAAKAQLALAEDAINRVNTMWSSGATSEAEVVQAKGQRELAAAQLESAIAARNQAKVLLKNHVLTAPFGGVIIRAPEGTGIPVGPQAPLFAIEDVRLLVLETSLTQEEVAELPRDAKVTVVVPATGARVDDATIRLIVPSVDPATNRVPVEITVPNPDGRLLPHAAARAMLPLSGARDVYRVSETALTQESGAFSLWMVGTDGKAMAVRVRQLTRPENGFVLVDPGSEGFPAGARVVETPPLGITVGAAITTPLGQGSHP